MMQSIVVAPLLMLLLSGGVITGLPLGMPPAAEEPAMSHVAPEECLLYLSWAATAEAAADSDNRTESLLAEPEVRRFINELQSRLHAALEKGAGQSERGQVVADEFPKIASALASHATAVFVERVQPGAAGVEVRAGLVSKLGEKADAFQRSLTALQSILAPGAFVTETTNGTQWQMFAKPVQGTAARWGIVDGYFMMTIGDDVHTNILKRLRAEQTPHWLSKLRTRLPVARTASVLYINSQQIMRLLAPIVGIAAPQQPDLLEKLGLTNIISFGSVTGLDAGGCVSRSWLELDGPPAGILQVFDAQPLSGDDLAPIPADAAVAAAMRLDARRAWEAFQELITIFDPRARDNIRRDVERLNTQLGFDVENDLLGSLGDAWRIYHSPSEGGTLFTNWTAVVSVRDPQTLQKVAAQIQDVARQTAEKLREVREQSGQRIRRVTIENYTFQDRQVSFTNFIGDDVPFAPAWCVTDEELVISLFPQGVNAYLTRRDDAPSLSAASTVTERFTPRSAPLLFVHYDSRRIFEAAYPLVQMFGNVLFAELQREGVDVNISILPSIPSIARHLVPASTSIIRSNEGIEFISQRSLPLGMNFTQLAVPMAMVNFRSVRVASSRTTNVLDALSPEAALRKVSINNLKQLMLALHNFHDSHNQFPAAAVTDKNGKPLLSWRVTLLPFLDQAALFREFRQDEPWDSPHNQALIKRMPEIFKAPGSKAEAGKTVYVGLRGENTAFPPGKGTRLRDFTDGTSNTLMLVEAADDHAVIWTKPDDLNFDPKQPLQGLVGLRQGGFLAALCDGSVRFVSESIDATVLKNLVIRNDGNAISQPIP